MIRCPHCGSPDIFRQHIIDNCTTEWVCERCNQTFMDYEDCSEADDDDYSDEDVEATLDQDEWFDDGEYDDYDEG